MRYVNCIKFTGVGAERNFGMEEFEEETFAAFSGRDYENLEAQLKLSAAEMTNYARRNGRDDLIFSDCYTPSTRYAGWVELFWDGLHLRLAEAGPGTDVQVRIWTMKGKRLWRLFVDSGHVIGGKYPKCESKPVQAPAQEKYEDKIKMIFFRAMEKYGYEKNANGIRTMLGFHGAKDVDDAANTGRVFRAWAEKCWKNKKIAYKENEPLITGDLAGFSEGNLLRFWESKEKQTL